MIWYEFWIFVERTENRIRSWRKMPRLKREKASQLTVQTPFHRRGIVCKQQVQVYILEQRTLPWYLPNSHQCQWKNGNNEAREVISKIQKAFDANPRKTATNALHDTTPVYAPRIKTHKILQTEVGDNKKMMRTALTSRIPTHMKPSATIMSQCYIQQKWYFKTQMWREKNISAELNYVVS